MCNNRILTIDPSNLDCPDTQLRHKSKPVDNINTRIISVIESLTSTIHNISYAEGISAIQIGIPLRIFVLNHQGEHGEEIVAINPKVLNRSESMTERKEGCLSLPDYMGFVNRYRSIEFSALNVHGNPFTYSANGYEAAIIQHELDHLKGILYWDRMEQDKTPNPIP